MGFKIGRVFELDFGTEGQTDAFGAVVKMRSASIATIREMRECDLDREAELIAEHVVEWNIENDDGPMPATAASVLAFDEPFRDIVANEWLKASRGITAPFDRRSAGGAPSPAEEPTAPSIQMEDL